MPLATIRSPAANRVALYHSFMQLYLPHNILPHERGLWLSHFEYMSMLVTTIDCPPHLYHALDAVSLVQVGSTRQEKRILHKAIESYTKALRSLAFAISNPKTVHNDTVLAAATLLSMAEFYTEFRLRGQTWIGHQQGMQKLIEARGPDSILASPLALHLFYQSTSSSMAMSLLLRKEDVYTTDVWRHVKAKAAVLDDYSESYRLGNRLPGLLERHDSLKPEDVDLLAKIDALLVDLGELEVEMKECLVNLHTQSAASDQSWFTLVDVKHFTPYADLVTDRTMTRAFRFPSFMTGHLHSSHWLRMYLLRDATRSLHKQRRALVHDWAPESDNFVSEKELLTYIVDLCRSIPCFVEPLNGAIGEMCSFFPLFVAEQYFRARSHWRWVRWVNHVSGRIFRKGMSMPFPTADPSLLPMDSEESLDYQVTFNLIETPSVPKSPSSSARGSPKDGSLTSSTSGS